MDNNIIYLIGNREYMYSRVLFAVRMCDDVLTSTLSYFISAWIHDPAPELHLELEVN